jgi:hypothetical protein
VSAQELAPGEIVFDPHVMGESIVSEPSPVQTESLPTPSLPSGEVVSSNRIGVEGMSTHSECASGTDCTSGDCGGTGRGRSGAGGRVSGVLNRLSTCGQYVGDIGAIERGYGQPDLFYNYYTNGMANRANAQMYLSPVPVPPNVGHTYFTYQPFYPEEMLYWHSNRFHNYYDNSRGLNRTHAIYYAPPVRQAASNIYWNMLRIPR